MKTCLVMEGGAMRGMYTAGVTDVMMLRGLKFDCAIGVSAGACFGCNYKSNQPGRVIRYNKRYGRDPEFMSVQSLIKTGDLYGNELCYVKIPYELDPFDVKAYEANPMDFVTVATDINTGCPVYHHLPTAEPEDLQWIRASGSMPVVSNIITLTDSDGETYEMLDGGIADPIPLEWAQSHGYDRCVVILTQPDGYVKKPNKLMPLIRRKYKRYPNLVRAMERRHELYNREVDWTMQAELDGKVFVVRPSVDLHIKRTENDPDKLQAAYDIGRLDAESLIDDLTHYVNYREPVDD